jgi:prepilin-type processing-associated H-X9-DG protein
VDDTQKITFLGQPSAFASRFAARHLGGGNLAFCDGHVSSHRGAKVVATEGKSRGAAIWPNAEILWSPDPEENPNTPGSGE